MLKEKKSNQTQVKKQSRSKEMKTMSNMAGLDIKIVSRIFYYFKTENVSNKSDNMDDYKLIFEEMVKNRHG